MNPPESGNAANRQELKEVRIAYALAIERAERYRRALQEIADMDYRGNRSPESEIAFRALTEVAS